MTRLNPSTRTRAAGPTQILKDGHNGAQVRKLQQDLRDLGWRAAVDGNYGGNTAYVVRRFQEQFGLAVDGVAGPQTLAKIASLLAAAHQQANDRLEAARTSLPHAHELRIHDPLARPGTSAGPQRVMTPTQTTFAPEPGRATGKFSSSKAGREQQAIALLKQNGAWPPVSGKSYVIQIDQDAPPGSASHGVRQDYLQTYTGEIMVFVARGNRLVEKTAPLRAAAHPGQMTAKRGTFTDVDGDRMPDIAHLRAGVYEYYRRPYGARYNPVSDRAMKVARDTTHDGIIDARDLPGDYYATYLQIHRSGSKPNSVGCQTLPTDDFARFAQALHGRQGPKTFTYLLVRRPNDATGPNPF